VGCTDAGRIGIAEDRFRPGVYYVSRRVPLLAFARSRIDLYQLREVNAMGERGIDGPDLGRKAIGAQLECLARSNGIAKSLNEGVRGLLVATPQSEVQNKLAVTLDGDECVGIPDAVAVRFVWPLVGFLLLNETPDFIALNIRHPDIANLLTHDPLAVLASEHQHREHGLWLHIAEPRRTANGVSFHKAIQDHAHLLLGEPHVGSEGLFLRLRKPLTALLALVALNLIAPLPSFDSFDPARMARHGGISY
jgi:hypothetical protein